MFAAHYLKSLTRRLFQHKLGLPCGLTPHRLFLRDVLADPKRVCPAYDAKAGLEIAGFVWLQQFVDLIDGPVYPLTRRIISNAMR